MPAAQLLLKKSRERAKDRQLPHTLVREEIEALLADGVCEFCRVPFQRARTLGENRPTSPTLDRLDPAAGYVLENVAVICRRCNIRKSDSSAADLRALADAVDRAIFARLPDHYTGKTRD